MPPNHASSKWRRQDLNRDPHGPKPRVAVLTRVPATAWRPSAGRPSCQASVPCPSTSQRGICRRAQGQGDLSAGRSLTFLLKSQAPLLCTPLECRSPATDSLGAPQTRSWGDGQDAQRGPLMQTSDLPREAAATRASPGKRAGYGAVLRRRPTGRGGLAAEEPQAGPRSAY